MNVEYLPFFEDEFFLRATNPERWNALISAIKDLRAENDPETNNRGVSGLLALLSASGGEGQSDGDDIIPILARRFAKDIERLQTDRGKSALLALQKAVETHHWKEDCPSFQDCAAKDEFRQKFIEQGKWKDNNVAYEHLLQKEAEIEKAHKESVLRKAARVELFQTLFAIPFLILLPIAMFLALIVVGLTSQTFPESFAIATAVLFSLEAAAVYVAFTTALSVDELTEVQSTRVMAIVASLVLCVVSLVITLLRPVPPGSQRFIGSQMCIPLALAQLWVGVADLSLMKDFQKLRELTMRDTRRALAKRVQ